MEYRILPHGGEKISVIGLGSGSITGTEQEMTAVLEAALQNGVNYFDMAPSERAPLRPMPKRLQAGETKSSPRCTSAPSIREANTAGRASSVKLKSSLSGN